MTVSTTYSLTTLQPEAQGNGYAAANQFGSDVISLANGGYAVAYGNPDATFGAFSAVSLRNSAFVAGATNGPHGPGGIDMQGDPAMVRLINGNIAIIWDEGPGSAGQPSTNDVVGAIVNPTTGAVIVPEFTVSSSSIDTDAEVAALSNGNWVVAMTNGADIVLQLMTPTGSRIGSAILTNVGTDVDPVVTGLADGGFAIAFSERTNDRVHVQAFGADGIPRTPNPQLVGSIDNFTSALAVAALPNGNFALVYDGDNLGLLLHIISPTGTSLFGPIRVDVNGAFSESKPDVTVLPNGQILVTWQDNSGEDSDIVARLFSSTGVPVFVNGANSPFFIRGSDDTDNDVDPSTAQIRQGVFVTSWTDDTSDGSGRRITTAVNEIFATITSDGQSDTIVGSAIRDVIVGGKGVDTAVFAGASTAYTITRGGNAFTVSGPDGIDTLTLVERAQFSDGTIALHHPGNDFNADGKSDVLFRQIGPTFDSNYQWQLTDRMLLSQGAIDLFDKSFSKQLIGDFDGDGKADVLFQNPTTGGVWQWRLDGRTIVSQGAVDVGDPSFDLLGAGDFNGDGKDDVLFRNDAGFVFMWQMNGRVDTPLPVGPLAPVWHVQGAGDFNGDGRDDILLHYKNVGNAGDPPNGAFVVWQMNGNAIETTLGIERPDPSWQTLGSGDFNGDGVDDLAIRNVSATPDNGAVWVYLLAGTVTSHGDGSKTLDILAQGATGIADPNVWHLQQIGDLNGDGKDDILFRNDAGYFYSWNMDGAHIASEGLLQGAAQWADPSFKVVTQHWDLV